MLSYYQSSIKQALKNYYSAFDSEEIAVALSGGVDSGTIIGMLHNITNKKVEAVSLSYNEKTDFNETDLIQFSARDHARNWTDLKLYPEVLFDDLQGLYNIFDGERDYHIPSSFHFIIMYLDMSTLDVRHFYISMCIKSASSINSFKLTIIR